MGRMLTTTLEGPGSESIEDYAQRMYKQTNAIDGQMRTQ